MLGVVAGHVIGLLIPQSWTDAVGHQQGDLPRGRASRVAWSRASMALVGMAILVYRRRTVGPVFSATTVMDKVMYAFLGTAIVLGMWNTIAGSILLRRRRLQLPRGRQSVWYRALPRLQPRPELMADAPIGFQLHALVAFGLFALWPFTRLVHVFSAPVGYLTRPYVVYRSRDERVGTGIGSRSPNRGWERP